MSNLTVRLPESLHDKLKVLAKAEGVSINQFMALAAAEKMSALATEDFLLNGIKKLLNEIKKGSGERLKRTLMKAPDVEPEERDRL